MRLFLLFLSAQAFLWAASGEGSGGTDIVYRVINFAIFAAILYYLLADRVVSFFKGRTQAIANDLEKAQVRLKEVKKLKEDALAKLEIAKKEAQKIIEEAKIEADLIINKAKESAQEDVKNYEKHEIERMELERRKVQRTVVAEVLKEFFNDPTLSINEKALLQTILKKVA